MMIVPMSMPEMPMPMLDLLIDINRPSAG